MGSVPARKWLLSVCVCVCVCVCVQAYDMLIFDSVVPTAVATLFGKISGEFNTTAGLGVNEMILLIWII